MNLPPSSCRWNFPAPHEWGDDDVVCIGADLEPDTLLYAYSHGLFPMFVDTKHEALGWWSPVERGIIPLDRFHTSRSLRRSARRFTVTVDSDFPQVMEACATSHATGNWIDDAFIGAYGALHRLGHAHSVEVWNEQGALVGGLYGVRINKFFAGESMFHKETDASKVALAHLVELMRLEGMTLLDTQWCTDHLASLGGISVPRGQYQEMLARAVRPD